MAKKLSKYDKMQSYMEYLTLPELDELTKAVVANDDEKVKYLMAKSASRVDKMEVVSPYLGKELARQQAINFMKKEMPELRKMSDKDLATMMGLDFDDIKIIEGVTPDARGKIVYGNKSDIPALIQLDPRLKDEARIMTLAHEYGHNKDFLKGFYEKLSELRRKGLLPQVPTSFSVPEIYKDPIGVSQKALPTHHYKRLFEYDTLMNLIKTGKIKSLSPYLGPAATAVGVASSLYSGDVPAAVLNLAATVDPTGASDLANEIYRRSKQSPEEKIQQAKEDNYEQLAGRGLGEEALQLQQLQDLEEKDKKEKEDLKVKEYYESLKKKMGYM